MNISRPPRDRAFRDLIIGIIAASFTVAGCGRDHRPNILLITVDTCRAGHLRCYGNAAIETPQLDALARQGILFENGICQAPLTLPSHSSIMTGLTPMAHGVRDNGSYRLSDGAVTLAELLRDRGYETAAVIGAFVLQSSFGLAQGFDVYEEDLSHGRLEGEFNFVERTADQVTAAASRWVEHRRGRRPFFLWVHYFDPHMTYAPPSPFRERYPRSPYDGEIAFADWQIGRLIETLMQHGDWARTLVLVVGDHGESLGEHGESTHSLGVYDAVLHVPLILSHPLSRTPQPPARWRPRRVAEQVETIDIFPTLADLTGGPAPHEVEGRSLLPLLDGAAGAAGSGAWRERPAYSETMVTLLTYGWAPLRAVRTRAVKYIRAPRPELYDLAADPDELRNLAPERPEEVAQWEAELARLAERAARFAVGSTEAGLSQAERDKLASLGYLQGGAAPATRELDPSELDHADPKDRVPAAWTYLMPGLEELGSDRPTEAEALFRAYLRVDPQCGEARFRLGLALRAQGRYAESLRELEQAERLNPSEWRAALHLGIACALTEQTKEARHWLEEAARLNPHSGDPPAMLGRVLEGEGDFAGALARYERALELDPGDPSYHLMRGRALEKMGRGPESVEEFRRAAELVPHSPRTYLSFGASLGESGHPELALRFFQDLASREPDNVTYRTNLGNCYLLTGDARRAVEEYRAAAAANPGDAQTQFLLGCAYAGLPDYARAQASWERAVELDPGHAAARQNLELLRRGEAPAGGVSFARTGGGLSGPDADLLRTPLP